MSTIKRINTLQDCPDADVHYIEAHNAYLVDGQPVYFEIYDVRKATIIGFSCGNLDELIEEFRFFNYEVTQFYGEDGVLLRSFPDVELTKREISELQPSQFYISEEKLRCCSSWIKDESHVVIPVCPDSNYICDGHTRLFAALRGGISSCYTYDAGDAGDYIHDFVRMAKERGIEKVEDMQLLSAEEYAEKWHKFCDDYFAAKR